MVRNLYALSLSLLFFCSSLIGQNCYVQLDDMSGIQVLMNQTSLENAACELIQTLPDSVQSQFKVYGFGFYILNDKMEGGFNSVWDSVIHKVESQTEYYLLFGKEIREQSYPTFRVALNLPESDVNACSSREEYIEHELSDFLASELSIYSNAQQEIQAMQIFISLNNCEDCYNEIDDDGDGNIDCEDLDCQILQLNTLRNENQQNRSLNCTVLSEGEVECLLEYMEYLEQIGVYDTETALSFCHQLDSLLNAPTEEVSVLNNDIEICNIYVPTTNIEPGRLLAYTEYRFPHNPPSNPAPDLEYGTDGDSDVIAWVCSGLLGAYDIQLENAMIDLLHFATNNQYESVANKMMQKFIYGSGGFYEEEDISNLIKETNELKNKVRGFGKQLEMRLVEVGGDIDQVNIHRISDNLRFVFSASKGYLRQGPTILINDVSQVKYHIQSYSIDSLGNWTGLFYVEAIDHFGLDDDDPNHKFKGIAKYQFLHCGFAAWWILQHQRNYVPFRTKLRFVVCLEGKIIITP